VGLSRLKRQPQSHAFTQQVLLANHLAQGFWAQAFSQRLVGGRNGGYQSSANNGAPEFNPALRLVLQRLLNEGAISGTDVTLDDGFVGLQGKPSSLPGTPGLVGCLQPQRRDVEAPVSRQSVRARLAIC
jgi:hypothetical protein